MKSDRIDSKELKKLHELGLTVEIKDENDVIIYKTDNSYDKPYYYCNTCKYMSLIDTPDPSDDFRATDQTAYCQKCNKVIRENINILYLETFFPEWCPFRKD